MTIHGFGRQVFGIGLAAALLAGCGGQSATTGAVPQGATAQTGAHAGSWMLPQVKAQDLLYASDNLGNEVYVFAYPVGRLVGTLTGFDSPVGTCVDKAADVWITNQVPPEVIEYAHGGTTPVATLNLPAAPYGCSIDLTSGNLAVTYGTSELSIFPNAQNPPTNYSAASLTEMQYGGYDDKGNFFGVGYTGAWPSEMIALGELPKGGSGINLVTFNKSINANVAQWDGAHLAVGGSGTKGRPPIVYQVDVSGSQATIVGQTTLRSHAQNRVWQQFWIQGGRIIQAIDHISDLGIWRYPNGGQPIKTIKQFGGREIWGVTISAAPSAHR